MGQVNYGLYALTRIYICKAYDKKMSAIARIIYAPSATLYDVTHRNDPIWVASPRFAKSIGGWVGKFLRFHAAS